MTAGVKIGGEKAKKWIHFQGEPKNSIYIPEEPDEDWWTAVLADEPQFENEVELDQSIVAEELDLLKRPQVRSKINWKKVQKIFANDEIIQMNVVSHNHGGILVTSEDFHGFVPVSHLTDIPLELADDDREQYLSIYLDREISLKVIECEPEKERIVFSERAALAKQGKRSALLHELMEGDIIKGVVTNITKFGAFVDLGGLEGLIHVSELSWGRVKHPSEILNKGDEVHALVLSISEEKGRIALSLKQLLENPWEKLSKAFSPGDVVDAVITTVVRYGAFAHLDEGVEGLIHISSMNFPAGCKHIDEFLYEGQQVRVCIINIDSQKRRLGLKIESN